MKLVARANAGGPGAASQAEVSLQAASVPPGLEEKMSAVGDGEDFEAKIFVQVNGIHDELTKIVHWQTDMGHKMAGMQKNMVRMQTLMECIDQRMTNMDQKISEMENKTSGKSPMSSGSDSWMDARTMK